MEFILHNNIIWYVRLQGELSFFLGQEGELRPSFGYVYINPKTFYPKGPYYEICKWAGIVYYELKAEEKN